MKKLFFAIALLSFGALQASAQENTFTKGTNIAGLGIGFGGNLYSGYYGSGISRIPAISAYYERCVVDNLWNEHSAIGVGGLAGFASAKTDYWKSTNIVIGVRGALHYSFLDKLDTYTGLMLGYDIVSFKWDNDLFNSYSSGATSGFTWSWFVGARYYFSDSFAAFVELGYGIAILNLGVSYKF